MKREEFINWFIFNFELEENIDKELKRLRMGLNIETNYGELKKKVEKLTSMPTLSELNEIAKSLVVPVFISSNKCDALKHAERIRKEDYPTFEEFPLDAKDAFKRFFQKVGIERDWVN